MKKNLPTKPLLFKAIALITCFLLVMLHNKSKAVVIHPISYTAKSVAVNFKQDAFKNKLIISIKSSSDASMQLFIFSPDGILLKEVAVSARKITTIQGLKRGIYLYECFDNDERMQRGSLIIK